MSSIIFNASSEPGVRMTQIAPWLKSIGKLADFPSHGPIPNQTYDVSACTASSLIRLVFESRLHIGFG